MPLVRAPLLIDKMYLQIKISSETWKEKTDVWKPATSKLVYFGLLVTFFNRDTFLLYTLSKRFLESESSSFIYVFFGRGLIYGWRTELVSRL